MKGLTSCIAPGRRKPKSVAAKPRTASWQMRPCLSSASRRKSMGTNEENPMGSNPTSPGGLGGRKQCGVETLVGLWEDTCGQVSPRREPKLRPSGLRELFLFGRSRQAPEKVEALSNPAYLSRRGIRPLQTPRLVLQALCFDRVSIHSDAAEFSVTTSNAFLTSPHGLEIMIPT